MLVNVTNDDGTTISDISADGMIATFLLSVGNEPRWTEAVTTSVRRCFGLLSNTLEYDCGDRVPMYLYDITDCAYLEIYLRCPPWNPFGLKECDYTYQYIEQCFGANSLFYLSYE